MRIKNKVSGISVTAILILFIISAVVTISITSSYFGNIEYEHSFSAFCFWVFNEPVFAGFLSIFYILTILAIVKRVLDIKKFNAKTNIRYVDFLPDRIDFLYNRPEQNFSCNYQDVKNLTMNINTDIITSKGECKTIIKSLNLKFLLPDNKKYNVTSSFIKTQTAIYKIIDYSKGMQNFEYNFEPFEHSDCKEKIEKYIHGGYKDFLGTDFAAFLKLLSFIFFCVSIAPTLMLFSNTSCKSANDCMLEIILTGILLIPVLILDIILIVDDLRDRNYRRKNG